MAYQAMRHKRVQEVLELVDENGKVQHTIAVDLDADTMAKQLSEKYILLTRAQQELRKVQTSGGNYEEYTEAIGNAIIELFEMVFGKENSDVIFKFYDSRYLEMSQEVLPFVVQDIIPKVRAVAQESKKKMLESYTAKVKGFRRAK